MSSSAPSTRAKRAPASQPSGLVKGLLFVGRYRLDERIARGGMGEVWTCWDLPLERTVIAKFIHPALVSEPSYLQRFEREMRSLAKLEHPNIVRLYGSGTEPQPYMIMELVRGITLRELIDKTKRIEPSYAVCYAIQLADGLGVVHGIKLAHRDIKPANIMVSRDGRGHVTILDLGIARSMTDRRTGETTDRLGTLGYVPPEMALSRPTDHRGDFYQLGVVLFEMLAGRKPYGDVDEASESEMQAAHAFAAPDPIRALVTECPEALAVVVDRLLAKDPDDRYQSSEEIVADLCAILRNTPPPDAQLAKTVQRQLVRKKLSLLPPAQREEPPDERERDAELPPPPSSGPIPIMRAPTSVTEPLRALVHPSPFATALDERQRTTLPLVPGAVPPKPTAPTATQPQTTQPIAAAPPPTRETISLPPGYLPPVRAPYPLAAPAARASASAPALVHERAPVPSTPDRLRTASLVVAAALVLVLVGGVARRFQWRAAVLRNRTDATATSSTPVLPATEVPAPEVPVPSTALLAAAETATPAPPPATTATAVASSTPSARPTSSRMPAAARGTGAPRAREKSASAAPVPPPKIDAAPKPDSPPKIEPPSRATNRLF